MTRRTAATMLSTVEMVAVLAADPDSCLASRARQPISVHTGRPPVPATHNTAVLSIISTYLYIYVRH